MPPTGTCAPRRRRRGFTLIELLIVMAVVAILGAVAYPSYAKHAARARRAEARAVLLEAAQFMERFYAANATYEQAVLPARLQAVPAGATSAAARFTLSVKASDATSYTLEAAPAGVDECGALELTSTGVRRRTGSGMTDEQCWR